MESKHDFFFKPNCKDMHEDIGARHVGFKGGHACHAREREWVWGVNELVTVHHSSGMRTSSSSLARL